MKPYLDLLNRILTEGETRASSIASRVEFMKQSFCEKTNDKDENNYQSNTEKQAPQESIKQINIEEEMKSSYIDYSMSVIVSRALTNIREGFEPVHRRILYGMFDMSNTPPQRSVPTLEMVRNCHISNLFSGIGRLEVGLDKIFTENTKSENKQILQQAIETFSEEVALEEVINELNELAEEHKIDKRIFNGRNAEECFSECVNNHEVWLVLEEVSRKWQGRGIEPSRASQLFLEAVTVAFYELRGNVDGWGKASFILRFAEEQLGHCIGIGVRAFQKGVQRIMNFFHRGAGNPIREAWKEKREDTIEVLRSLVNMIKSALLDKMPALALAN